MVVGSAPNGGYRFAG